MSPPSSSPSNSNPRSSIQPTITPSHSPHHSLSGISAAKSAIRRSTTLNRRPTLNSSSSPSSSSSSTTTGHLIQSEEIERDKLKLITLKSDYDALLAASEQREADSIRDSQLWKSRAIESSEQIQRLESDLVHLHEIEERTIKLSKDLDRYKSINKEQEHQLITQNEEFDTARSLWAETENQLKDRITNLIQQLNITQREDRKLGSLSSELGPENEDEMEPGQLDFNRSLQATAIDSNPISSPPSTLSTLQLEGALDESKKETSKAMAEADGLRRALAVLRDQLADAERVNEQLMEDNESYQFLVGERTLMGGFDIKQLLAVNQDDDEPDEPDGAHERVHARGGTPPSTSGSSLADVEEEDEDGVDEIERAVLESHGNGSRTTGAVEAEVMSPKSARHQSKKTRPGNDNSNGGGGGGLDLAAELAQAEQSEEIETRRKDIEERRKKKGSTGRTSTKDKDAEIKFLTDANKALVLYISKILDRIQATEGFEKVLATDYKDKTPNSPSHKTPTASSTTGGNPTPGVVNIANSFLNVLTKSSTHAPDRKTLSLASASTTSPATSNNPPRPSWLQFFTASRSPPAQAGIKPLKLGTGSTGLNSGWQGVKEGVEEEDEEDLRERERLRAELKLHGIDKTAPPGRELVQRSSSSQDGVSGSNRASRRGSSMYGTGSAMTSSGCGGVGVKRSSADPMMMIPSSPPPITPAGYLKRSEEREKESKINLEKGQASGFTEIEIRGSRLRPAGHQRLSGTLSPTLSSVSGGGGGGSTSPHQIGGIKDLKMSGSIDGVTSPNSSADEGGILARTAKRISLMRS